MGFMIQDFPSRCFRVLGFLQNKKQYIPKSLKGEGMRLEGALEPPFFAWVFRVFTTGKKSNENPKNHVRVCGI